MTPISRELMGLLKHDHFGSHFDIFETAGIVLANICSQWVIDDFPVVSEFILQTDTGC